MLIQGHNIAPQNSLDWVHLPTIQGELKWSPSSIYRSQDVSTLGLSHCPQFFEPTQTMNYRTPHLLLLNVKPIMLVDHACSIMLKSENAKNTIILSALIEFYLLPHSLVKPPVNLRILSQLNEHANTLGSYSSHFLTIETIHGLTLRLYPAPNIMVVGPLS